MISGICLCWGIENPSKFFVGKYFRECNIEEDERNFWDTLPQFISSTAGPLMPFHLSNYSPIAFSHKETEQYVLLKLQILIIRTIEVLLKVEGWIISSFRGTDESGFIQKKELIYFSKSCKLRDWTERLIGNLRPWSFDSEGPLGVQVTWRLMRWRVS